jgi:hypothetical protein
MPITESIWTMLFSLSILIVLIILGGNAKLTRAIHKILKFAKFILLFLFVASVFEANIFKAIENAQFARKIVVLLAFQIACLSVVYFLVKPFKSKPIYVNSAENANIFEIYWNGLRLSVLAICIALFAITFLMVATI